MKKSGKVTEVNFTTEWKNPSTGKPIYYHNVTIDNGDIINIGFLKKNDVKVGDELHYEITGATNSEGALKAKRYNPEYENKPKQFAASFTPQKTYVDNSIGMMVGSSINNASLLAAHKIIDVNDIAATSEVLCEISLKLKEKFSK